MKRETKKAIIIFFFFKRSKIIDIQTLYSHKFVKFYQILKQQRTKLPTLISFLIGMLLYSSLWSQNAEDKPIAEPLDSALTLDSNNVPKTNTSIKNQINYDAVDSIWFNVAKQEATLFGQAHLDYGDVKIDAPQITVNLKNSTLVAVASYDSAGKIIDYPMLKQKDDEFQAKVIEFNYQTNRGYIEDVYMQQGEGYLHTNQAYLDENKTMYVKDASYTTCNLANPHYHFHLNKAKVIPDDKIIASMINLYIDSIPTPIGVPFGLFPTKDVRSSGILLPNNFGTNTNGYFLQGFGYYWAINDSLAMKFTGEIYSKGTFGLANDTEYRVRYKYSGRLNVNFRNNVNNGDEFTKNSTKTFSFSWSHRPVSTKGRRMQADVNYQSVKFNRFNYTQNDQLSIPQVNSSVTWNLPLTGIPFTAVVSMKHSQNKTSNSGEGTNIFNVPDFNVNYSGERNPYKLLPYTNAKPSGIRKNILEQFSVSYSAQGNNRLSSDAYRVPNGLLALENIDAKDTLNLELNRDNLPALLARNKFSMAHSATLQNNIKLKYFTLTPRISYTENWYFNQSNFNVDLVDSTMSYANNPGFYRFGRYSAGASLSTTFYNFYTLGKVKTKQDSLNAIKIDRQYKFRHQITPSITYNTTPAYDNNAQIYDIFVNGNDSVAYNRYFLYQNSPSSSGKSQNISFNVTNFLELKTPDSKSKQMKSDYVAGVKNPIKLLQLSGSAAYNLAADSLNLSNIALTASNTNLLKGLMGFSATASFDPYQYEDVGTSYRRVNKYWASDNGFPARLQTLQLNSNLSLNPSVFTSIKNANQPSPDPNVPSTSKTSPFSHPDYLDFSLPWSIQLNYTYIWQVANPRSDTIRNNSINMSSTLKLSENWSSTFSLNYNITKKEFTYPNLSLNRDLHCWYMKISWVPFGPSFTRGYNFFIGVKANILQDLKYNKRNSPYDRIN